MTDAADPTPVSPSPDGEIVAERDLGHFVKRCVLIPLLVVGAGAFFLFDGYVRWPNENARYDAFTKQIEAARAKGDARAEADAAEARKAIKPHSELDLTVQKVLGFVLPPLGALAFAFFYRQSRGRFRLAGDVLHAPGHPPVPLDAIRTIDKSKWDRKGIAYIGYELDPPAAAAGTAGATGTAGTIKLDDALYQQGPTAAILKAIEAKVAPAEDVPPAVAPTEPATTEK